MKSYIHSYQDLVVWKKAVELSVQIYKLTEQFPKEEKYGLISQMQRSSVSIASNIAEGKNRNSLKEYIHFLSIAFGSGAELETQIIIAKQLPRLSHCDFTSAEKLLTEIMKMLNSLMSKLAHKT